MEKKVYEGYKRTSANSDSVANKKSTAEKSAVTNHEKVSPKTSRKPNARLSSKNSIGKPRLAMFIDVENVGISRENLLEILFYANGKYQIEICKLYGFSDETLPGIRDIANEYNVVTVGRMKFKQAGMNCLDSRLLIDAYECALNNRGKIDMIFLWCYPCDLVDLFKKIIDLGINTATIDNNIFDCKNNFVSQTFKLYSPYNFDPGISTYGKVKNEPAEIAPDLNFDTDTADEKNMSEDTSKVTVRPDLFNNDVPPVLPRRTILERSGSSQTASKTEPELPTESSEENARKLNLQVPSTEELAEKEKQTENADNQKINKEVFMDMFKLAGLDDLVGENELKYEDTIGDL